jgi:hypothetical protein
MPPKDKSYSLDNIIQAGNWGYSTGSSLYTPMVVQSLLSAKGKKKLVNLHVSGMLVKSLDDLFKYIESKGGVCTIAKTTGDYTYIWEDSFLDIDYNKKNQAISLSGLALDPELVKMMVVLEKDYITKVKKNLVFTIVKTSVGFDIKNMGDGSSPLISDNYLPEVLEDIDFVLKSFKKTPPAGRICILNGEPGTGKTHLIRSVLMQLDCVFLIIPSNLIDSLDKPEFVPLLMNIKNEHEKPIIMIIEDGDVCLVPRKNDNISTIASLLNLSDGILGSIIDIKMIISTNAAITEMDQAILRPGRLCRNIHVGPLPFDQANKVYQRLMSTDTVWLPDRRHYTLAEIYDKVNNIDTQPQHTSNNKRVIGFSSVRSSEDRVMNKKIGF